MAGEHSKSAAVRGLAQHPKSIP